MGQKSNILTVRKALVQYNSSEKNQNQFILTYLVLQHLQKLFLKSDVCLLQCNIQENSNKIYIAFDIFFRTRKLIKLKKFFKKLKFKNNLKQTYFLGSIIKFIKAKFFSFLIVFKFSVSNRLLLKKNKLQQKLLVEFYDLFRRYSKLLFPRRINFFLDFIKLSVILFCGSLRVSFFIKLLAEIFTILQKKRHSFFLQFIKFFFSTLITFNLKTITSFTNNFFFNKICGIKFIASGKLKGKPRASSLNLSLGNIPTQSLALNIEYSKIHIFTRYGVYGFKLWLNREYVSIK